MNRLVIAVGVVFGLLVNTAFAYEDCAELLIEYAAMDAMDEYYFQMHREAQPFLADPDPELQGYYTNRSNIAEAYWDTMEQMEEQILEECEQ